MKKCLATIKNFFSSTEGIVFSVTLLVHIIIVLVLSDTSLTSFQMRFAGDQLAYHGWANEIADLLKNGTYHFDDVYPHHWYPLFIGVLYVVFGSSMLLGSVVNAVLVSIAAVLFFKILKAHDVSKKFALITSIIVFNGYANFVFHTSIMLKEAWIVLLVVGILYMSSRMTLGKGNRMIIFGAAFVMFLALFDLRFFIGFGAITVFLIDWLINGNMDLRKRLLYGFVMIGVVAITSFLLLKKDLGGTAGIVQQVSPEAVYTTRVSYAQGGGSNVNVSVFEKKEIPQETIMQVEPSTKKSKYFVSLKGLLLSGANVFFGPFPWQVTLVKYIIAIPDLLFVYATLVVALLGSIIGRLPVLKKVAPYIIGSLIIFGTLVIASDNLGAIIRQRIPAVIIVAVIAGLVIESVCGWVRKFSLIKKQVI